MNIKDSDSPEPFDLATWTADFAITRRMIDDGREPDPMLGIPLETDAELRARFLGYISNPPSEVVVLHAMTVAMPQGVRWAFSQSKRSVVNVATDRALNDDERREVIEAAERTMMVPGFSLTFSELDD